LVGLDSARQNHQNEQEKGVGSEVQAVPSQVGQSQGNCAWDGFGVSATAQRGHWLIPQHWGICRKKSATFRARAERAARVF